MPKIVNGVDEQVTQRQFRVVYRLVPQEIEMEALREGDIFFILPASEDDVSNIDPSQLMIATGDGQVIDGQHDLMGRRAATVDFENAGLVDKDSKPIDLGKIQGRIKGKPDWQIPRGRGNQGRPRNE